MKKKLLYLCLLFSLWGTAGFAQTATVDTMISRKSLQTKMKEFGLRDTAPEGKDEGKDEGPSKDEAPDE